MAEAKRKSLQAKDARDILVEKLKDGSLEPWQRRKIELRLKLKGEGWSPEKKLATSSMEKIRLLNAEFPEVWTMQRLSKQFKVSQEAIRRILKSKFQPSETQTLERETKRKAQIKEYKNSQLKRMQ
ncbi:Required for respiratory growth protein 9 mitochondrial [Coemansia sp. RSA 1813]|nr:Required for respiratory growth protein 9 mitochondrial [Coemansia sp. RSA 1646]KAJ1772822.1 Required for respiratory growth protein 9 mitochondrial [Coemansia sp. RSA 1843]KAJ2088911.1 Required for respiratory growth protein 9 mitochondrial [Coemansia sp. RSA 986]KAJ2568756.1 Required for respiratory growth protein 9 mitochondrial [Coemansia sp. RSA 1813]